MATPTRMTGRKPVRIAVHSVMDIMNEIHKQGHGDAFREAAKNAGAVMSVHPKTVNFVKSYFAENNMHANSQVGKNVVGPPKCPNPDPQTCPYHEPS